MNETTQAQPHGQSATGGTPAVIAGAPDLRALFARVNNWGRWGGDDELGTLNYITDEVRLAALGTVVRGHAVSIAQDLDTVESALNPVPTRHRMLEPFDAAVTAVDEFAVAPHGFATTHVDALAHCFFDGHAWNGRLIGDVVGVDGISFGSVHAQRHGVLTRGVLLDVAASRGVEWLEPGDAVSRADLDAAEIYSGERVGRGDAVFVRVGTGARARVHGAHDPSIRAGIGWDAIEWFHEREIAVYSGDCVDVTPHEHAEFPDFFHQIALAGMGLSFLDCPDVEVLKEVCVAEGRSAFLLSYAALRLVGGTGSPVNPVVVF